MERINKIAAEAAEWSDKTFGSYKERGPLPPIYHLKKEVEELLKEPYDKLEYADRMLLILDAAHRAGYNINQLLDATEEKLLICKARQWGKPDKDGVICHV